MPKKAEFPAVHVPNPPVYQSLVELSQVPLPSVPPEDEVPGSQVEFAAITGRADKINNATSASSVTGETERPLAGKQESFNFVIFAFSLVINSLRLHGEIVRTDLFSC